MKKLLKTVPKSAKRARRAPCAARRAPKAQVWMSSRAHQVSPGGRTLGLGFSPGDEGCAEPYLYALPQPAPAEPPALEPPFEWTSDGWSGAVLRGANVVALDAARQAELVERFYRTAVDALVRDQRGAPGSSSPA
jgi:hypothetical protein